MYALNVASSPGSIIQHKRMFHTVFLPIFDASLHRIPKHTVNQYVYFIETEHQAENAHGNNYVVYK
jgi:hypothetical protein